MAIEDNLCIVANERELPPIDAFSAALFWTAAKKRRRNEPLRKNHQFLGVCDQKLVGYSPIERTLTIILPNTIHGCKKLNLRRSK